MCQRTSSLHLPRGRFGSFLSSEFARCLKDMELPCRTSSIRAGWSCFYRRLCVWLRAAPGDVFTVNCRFWTQLRGWHRFIAWDTRKRTGPAVGLPGADVMVMSRPEGIDVFHSIRVIEAHGVAMARQFDDFSCLRPAESLNEFRRHSPPGIESHRSGYFPVPVVRKVDGVVDAMVPVSSRRLSATSRPGETVPGYAVMGGCNAAVRRNEGDQVTVLAVKGATFSWTGTGQYCCCGFGIPGVFLGRQDAWTTGDRRFQQADVDDARRKLVPAGRQFH